VRPLEGRTALVTGASRGIGAATAGALRAAGARVVRVARTLAPGERDGFLDIPCDVADPSAVQRLGAEVGGRAGAVHVVVNAAGVFDLVPFAETSAARFADVLAVNLVGAFAVTRAFVPAMRERGDGHVVTIGSVADAAAFPGNTMYAAGKFGLRGLHETLVAEYRGTGVRFTLVSPGPTDTAAWDPVKPDERPGFVRRADMLRPADVAEAVIFAVTRPPRVQVESLRLGPA
jgi:NAD(P)-dependent dehydrogenase (short-subunit alcohol dehydrogenase family)